MLLILNSAFVGNYFQWWINLHFMLYQVFGAAGVCGIESKYTTMYVYGNQ